jgi:hypothetical protein
MFLLVIDFIEFDNVWSVADSLEIGYLIFQGIAIAPKHFGSIYLFDCVFLAQALVLTDEDSCEGTVTEL